MSSLVEYDQNPLAEPEVGSPNMDGPAEGMQTNLLAIAWQARWLLMLTVLVGIGAAWILLQRAEPRYTSMSRLYIERSLPKILTADTQFADSTSYLYTQAELLRSTPVLAAVVDDPANRSLETFRDPERADNPVGFLFKELQIEVGQNDDIINVALELPNAEEAAQIVNAVVDAYISEYAEKRRKDTVEVLNILRSEKQDRDAELAEQLQKLEVFRNQNAALAVQVGEENVISSRFAALARELDRVELELLDAKARHHRTQQMFETPSQRVFLFEVASAQNSVVQEMRMENQLLVSLEEQVQNIELQINELRATWGDGHARVKTALQSREALEQRRAEQQTAITERKEAIITAYVETIAQEYHLLEQKREELQRSYDQQFKLAIQVSSQAAKLKTLEDGLERTIRLVDILDERIKEVNLSEDVGAMNVNIMEVAKPSIEASYPVPALFVAVGAFLGGLSGFGLAWLRDLLDHRLKSIDEITATMQLPVLGALPLSAERDNRQLTGRVVIEKPRSVAAEAFRTLRTAIHFGLTRDEAKVIAVTSPSPGDGKSTMASNLALVMAQADQRVLLIDADMRKPKQHEIFGVSAQRGLSAVLAERQPAEDFIVPVESSTLELLPCGSCPSNPVELLNNGFFAEFLEELKSKYDKIVIDAPPVMPVADARVIAAQTEATILVLRADRSTRRLSLAARDELWRVRAQRLGIVVNAVPGRKQADYASGYGYGYGSYGYASGGYSDLAYGEADTPLESSKRKKSRAIAAEASPVESLETADADS